VRRVVAMQRRYECTFNVRIAAGCGFGVDALLTSSSLRWGKELDLEEDIEGCENAEEYCET
jgi:hypothetical protein